MTDPWSVKSGSGKFGSGKSGSGKSGSGKFGSGKSGSGMEGSGHPEPASPRAGMSLLAGAVTMRSHPRLVAYQLSHPDWTPAPIRIAVIADIHGCVPWTTLAMLRRIVERTNALAPDLVVLAGDVIASRRMPARRYPAAALVAELAGLHAPLGVWSVMGNHDWWDCDLSWRSGFSRNSVIDAHAAEGIAMLRNQAVRIETPRGPFWLVGLDSQQARKRFGSGGFDDADLAFAAVTDDAPAILLAHEPDIFAQNHTRACLQISGHTHGGQLNLFGRRPMTPSALRDRYAYGHVTEHGRHLVVSGGIGYSGLPLRVAQPPEITLITLSGPQAVVGQGQG